MRKMHQRRGAGGGVRGRERRAAERRGAMAAERKGIGQRDSIADGTALHRGRGGSRHFRRHRGFIPEGSLFVSLRVTGYLLSIFFASPLICPSKK